MDFRRGVKNDLPQLRQVFGRIVADMDSKGVAIWDEVYPCAFFAEDIAQGSLWVLLDGETIVSAFALCADNAGARAIAWQEPSQQAMYLDRFGVNVDYAGRGYGGMMLTKAAETAKAAGAAWLRLFVVDVNTPAIHLYEKHGFVRGGGVYDEVLDDGFALRELGYELRL